MIFSVMKVDILCHPSQPIFLMTGGQPRRRNQPTILRLTGVFLLINCYICHARKLDCKVLVTCLDWLSGKMGFLKVSRTFLITFPGKLGPLCICMLPDTRYTRWLLVLHKQLNLLDYGLATLQSRYELGWNLLWRTVQASSLRQEICCCRCEIKVHVHTSHAPDYKHNISVHANPLEKTYWPFLTWKHFDTQWTICEGFSSSQFHSEG